MSRKFDLGIDIGGTKIAIGWFSEKGDLLQYLRIPTLATRPAQDIIVDITQTIKHQLEFDLRSLRAVGVAVAGQVDPDAGVVRYAPNLKWNHLPILELFSRELKKPASLINDVRAATLAEWNFGAARGQDDFICLFIGTGIGGGVVSAGSLISGASHSAGELGHVVVVHQGRKCRCLNFGCVEAYAGGWAIAQQTQELVRADLKSGTEILKWAGTIDRITAKHVAQAYFKNDSLAMKVIVSATEKLGSCIASLVNAFNPRFVLLGGGIIEGLPKMMDGIEEQVRHQALKAAVEPLMFKKAELGGKAPIIGAALWARHAMSRVHLRSSG